MRTRELWINRMSRTATFASLFNCNSQSKDTYKERHITLHATVLHFGLLHKRMCMRSAEFIKTKRICNSCKSNGSAARWLGRARRLCVFVATSHTVRSMLAAISSAHLLCLYLFRLLWQCGLCARDISLLLLLLPTAAAVIVVAVISSNKFLRSSVLFLFFYLIQLLCYTLYLSSYIFGR